MVDPEDTEQWSDIADTIEDDNSVRNHPNPRGIEEVGIQPPDISSSIHAAVKIVATGGNDKLDEVPALESPPSASLPTSRERSMDDADSTRSLPVVRVTEPQSPQSQTTPPSPRQSQPPLSTPRSRALDDLNADRERRHRHRSAAEIRSSSRLSGFFNNLIHRRDHPPASSSRHTREDSQPSSPNVPRHSSTPSRASSPPPPRPVTPPPKLPAPTLQELGLSFSVVTQNLSPSHFSTPPTSGAFLGPHYLLLCHAQGLDVLPLISPPVLQPYALVRRVSFKSVVVMEQRGVLVAIAGRRDGVRVYALEEVKKAVEWRIDVEIRREKDRMRREATKKITSSIDSLATDERDSNSNEKTPKPRPLEPPPALTKKKSERNLSFPGANSSGPKIPRAPTIRISPALPHQSPSSNIPEPLGRPPPYSSPQLRSQPSVISIRQRSRSGSVQNVLAGSPSIRRTETIEARISSSDPDVKIDWSEDRESDDEAIDIVAAGASGSQALDERTSAMAASSNGSGSIREPLAASTRRNRPANLDLTLTRNNSILNAPPSPSPTLLTLRQALANSSPYDTLNLAPAQTNTEANTPNDEDEEEEHQVSLAQVLMESRLPDLPPAGSRRPQEPILISPTTLTEEPAPSSPRGSEYSTDTRRSVGPERRRRRWSVLDGVFMAGGGLPVQNLPPAASSSTALSRHATNTTTTSTVTPSSSSPRPRFNRSQSQRTQSTPPEATMRSAPSVNSNLPSIPPVPRTSMPAPSVNSATSSRSNRFLPKLFGGAFHSHRKGNGQSGSSSKALEDTKKMGATPAQLHTPPPKLEYVKLPGTKGAVMIKAVETPKKSFLAILCGENGEKVELFAGTYRTALGLSRTFILPDSPRSLELQLQGDDLVEVFLVFQQNVFGLEPATVRVREVRIGRAERRAARRRAREIRSGDSAANETDANALAEEDTNVNVSIGVTVANTSGQAGEGADGSAFQPRQHPSDSAPPNTENNAPSAAVSHADELVALATAQMGAYTTFQQLSFAPNFPLASIADDYVIPPTYSTFLDYRNEHEPDADGSRDLAQVQFSPPGLPLPTPSAPSKWFYKDPKGVVHGPWKASLMQAWYKDGLLPPDLPVRREEDADYTLLKELRQQSLDPSHPFRTAPPPPGETPLPSIEDTKPLLQPISLLSQPRHFGPPALFFSSRGGHSTTIVDARGRSVLKGRFVWSEEPEDDQHCLGRMGDVKRLEAFDVKDRSVLIALRQGGLEAVDLSDALLRPADESRTVLPQFMPPPSNTNRRVPFVWKMGSPVSSSPNQTSVLPSKRSASTAGGKKPHSASHKAPSRTSDATQCNDEVECKDEVLFLGRKDDEVYFCERNAGAFRILRLCPST